MDADPGVPWKFLGSTKEKLLERHSDLVIEAVINRISLLWNTPEAELRVLGPAERVKRGFCDPVRVFVKNEPHSVKKISEGRYRLVASVSIVDEIVEKLVFYKQLKKEIEVWPTIPSKAGMGIALDEDAALLLGPYLGKLKEMFSCDVSGWDWTCQKWDFEEATQSFLANISNRSEGFDRVARNRIDCLMTKVLATSDGNLYCLGNGNRFLKGIQASGTPTTSGLNSRARCLLAYYAGSRDVFIAMGDDFVGDSFGTEEEMVQEYAKLGRKLTNVVIGDPDKVEFCSNLVYSDRFVPLNIGKMLYNLLDATPGDDERFMQLIMELRNSPQLENCIQAIDESGWASNGEERKIPRA